jgi:putative acetyltransferase
MPDLHIRSFQPDDALAFRILNEEWITKYFDLEEQDRHVLSDPDRHILQPGGHIFMGFAGNQPIGCCALVPIRPGVFELAKMAVSEEYRGRGIGRKILEYTIARARELGIKTLFLGSNTKLANAIHLYKSFGFYYLPPESAAPSPYARANVFMELQL